MVSIPVPGVKGTTILMFCVGYALCAKAPVHKPPNMRPVKANKLRRSIEFMDDYFDFLVNRIIFLQVEF
jgi:hypothetical protein